MKLFRKTYIPVLLRRWGKYLSFFVITLGIVALAGWLLNSDIFTFPLESDYTPMHPVTAIAFIFLGLSYICIRSSRHDRKIKYVGYSLAAIVVCISLIKLFGEVIHINTHLESFLYSSNLDANLVNNMLHHYAPNTGFCLLGCSIAFFLLNNKTPRKRIYSQYLALIILSIALLSLLGYLYRVPSFCGFSKYTSMTLSTTVGFFCLSAIILFTRPVEGLMKVITGPELGSSAARRLVPLTILFPIVFGYLRLVVYWGSTVSVEFGTAILMLSIIIVFLPVIIYNAVSLNQKERLRKETEKKLEILNRDLEQRVQERTAELAASENRFRAMIENSYDSILLCDRYGVPIYQSPSANRMLGWTLEERKNSPRSHKFVHPDDVFQHKSAYSKATSSPGKPIYTCHRLLHKAGHYILAEGFVTSLLHDNSIKAVISNLRDITERRKVEEELDKSERRFRTLIEKNAEMMTLTRPDGVSVYVSPAVSVLGYTVEEFKSRSVFERIHPEDLPNVTHSITKLLTTPGQSLYLEHRFMHKNGNYRWCAGTLTNMIHDPCIGALVANFRDVSEKKSTEEEIKRLNTELEKKVKLRTAQLEAYYQHLKESEEKFEKVFMASSAGISITRFSNLTYMDVNDAFVELTGYLREELIGHSMTELNLLTDCEKHDEITNQLETYGRVKLYEMTICHKTGKLTDVLTSIETVTIRGEKFTITIIYDITEQKRSEELLKKSNTLFSALFNLNPASLSISRISDGRILDVNTSFLELFGLKGKDEAIGKTAHEVGIVFSSLHREGIQNVIREKRNIFNSEDQFDTPQGQSKWATTSIIKIETADNGSCLLAVNLDITDLKRTEEQLRSVNKELESFSYTVSHDLRAPLRAVDGYAKMFEEDYGTVLNDNGKRLLSIIQYNAVKMSQLIDDLLSFSRLGRKSLQVSQLNMNNLVEGALTDINKANPHKAKVKVSSLHPTKGDYTLLNQVFVNLISNAIKYSSKKESPTVEISSEHRVDRVVYIIKDNGDGFDMKYVNKLFDVFQRLHTPEEFEGTGVGLAIVQRIVSKHGGKVWAYGERGKGATFSFELPVN